MGANDGRAAVTLQGTQYVLAEFLRFLIGETLKHVVQHLLHTGTPCPQPLDVQFQHLVDIALDADVTGPHAPRLTRGIATDRVRNGPDIGRIPRIHPKPLVATGLVASAALAITYRKQIAIVQRQRVGGGPALAGIPRSGVPRDIVLHMGVNRPVHVVGT